MTHFQTVVGFSRPGTPAGRGKTLVAWLIACLEAVIGWRARPTEDDGPVLEPVVLVEDSKPARLGHAARVKVLSRGLSAGHEEDVIARQGGRVHAEQNAEWDKCDGDAELVGGLGE